MTNRRHSTSHSWVVSVWALARGGFLRRWPEVGAVMTMEMTKITRALTIEPARLEGYDMALRLADGVANHLVPLTTTRVGFGTRHWFLCPRCRRKCEKLYRPPLAREFLCWRCHELTFRWSLSRRDWWDEWDRYIRALADMDPESQMREITPIWQAWVASLMACPYPGLASVWGHDVVRGDSVVVSRLIEPSERELARRAAASWLEAFEQAAQELRGRPTVGRPRTKRPYRRNKPFTAGPRRSDDASFCVKCRAWRDMKEPQAITMRNGRRALQGACTVCGTRTARFVAAGGLGAVAGRLFPGVET